MRLVQELPDPTLLLRVDEGEEEANGHRRDAGVDDTRRDRSHRLLVEPVDDLPRGVDSAGHLEDAAFVHERVGVTEGEVEQVAMSLLLLHLNGTAQAGGQQESARDMATLD